MEHNSNIRRIKFMREGGAVRRCHTRKIIGEYDVAQHSFNILCMLRVLFPECSKELIWACLTHDIPERFTGDIPAPAKWFGAVDRVKLGTIEDDALRAFDIFTDISEGEHKILKGLDILELYLWALDQIAMGNSNERVMKHRIEKYIEANVENIPFDIFTIYRRAKESSWEMLEDLGEQDDETQL